MEASEVGHLIPLVRRPVKAELKDTQDFIYVQQEIFFRHIPKAMNFFYLNFRYFQNLCFKCIFIINMGIRMLSKFFFYTFFWPKR